MTDLSPILVAFDLSPAKRIAPAGGTASPKWIIDTARGRWVLRVRPAEFARREFVEFDHAALSRLAAAGLPVPRPLPRPDGSTWLCRDGLVYEMLSWVEGEPFVEGDEEAIEDLGRTLARFHQVPHGDLPPGKRGRPREDHPDLMAPYLDQLRDLARTTEERRVLDRIGMELDTVRRELDDGLLPKLPVALIHGDAHPGNIRFRGSRVAAIYDFDYLSVQSRTRDVIDGLMFFATRRRSPMDPNDIRSMTQAFTFDPARSVILLRGYQQVFPLSEDERRAMPLLIRSRWVQMRLRGARKVAVEDKVHFAIDHFAEVPDQFVPGISLA